MSIPKLMIGSKPQCHNNAAPLSQSCQFDGTTVTKEWHGCDNAVAQFISQNSY
ncbi:hypothetical protein [Bacteroides finegoldii]